MNMPLNTVIKQETAETLFAGMLRIRLIEEAIAARYSQQKMRCPTHLSIGQEAVAVGVSHALQASDKAYSSHRAHAHYLAKGGSLNKLIAELYGKSTGCTGGRGGSMHLCDLDAGFIASTAIVANSIPVAVGHALHLKSQNKPGVVVTYFGDGATEEGAFYESVNFAVLKALPILFVCENNFYSVYSPLSVRQPEGHSIARMVTGMGLESHELDGNNAIAVCQQTHHCLSSIRQGDGPQLLECFTYRHREHCGPHFDDDLGYRPQDEVALWQQRDPLSCFAEHCKAAGLATTMSAKKIAALEEVIQQEIQQAFELAEASKFPVPTSAEEFLYAK